MQVEQNIEATIYNVISPRRAIDVLNIIYPDEIINENLGQEDQEQNIEDIIYNVIPPIPPTGLLNIIHPDEILGLEAEMPEIDPPILPRPQTEPFESPEANETFIKGKFLYVKDEHSREMLVNAWNAINQLELWNYMRRETYSYMFSDDDEIWTITKKMEELGYNGHSGFSFGWTMRQIQYIAQHGEEKYRDEVISNYKNGESS